MKQISQTCFSKWADDRNNTVEVLKSMIANYWGKWVVTVRTANRHSAEPMAEVLKGARGVDRQQTDQREQ
jgi:hypothetical protein